MGQVVLHGGLSDRLYQGVSQWTRIIPGGLTHSNILSCSLFAAVSGSSLATAATIGTVAYPAQTEKGYNASLVTGSLAAGGTLGILIPPSINMIVYGAFVGVSVGKLFIGGVIPGFGLAALFMTYIFFVSVMNPSLGPPPDKIHRRYFLEALIALKDIWPMLLIILTIMGGIYGGIMTPTEAAGISALIALAITAAYRRLNLNMLKKAAIAALRTTAMVLILVMAAQVLGAAVSMLKIPAQLCAMVVEAELNRYVVWFIVVFIVIVLGCFMDGLSIMLFTLPVLFPLLVTTLGFHPLVVGIFMVIQAECALVTPPVGINLYIIHGIAKGTDMMTVIKGAIPFFLLMLVMIVLITYFTEMVLFLPGMMIGR
jgi:tripartite ATP-independent transporter DctM subunit